MLQECHRTVIERATVHLTRRGGQGVLVEGNFILTAAHCIDWSCDGGLVLGDHAVEDIDTSMGKLKVSILAVEPVNDIAVLGSLDCQVFAEEVADFERFCENTDAVPLCTRDLDLFESIPVYIRTHEQSWVNGNVQQCNTHAQSLSIEAAEQIKGGTSGGPVVNEFGKLVGIVSNFSDINIGMPPCHGSAPRPHLALPNWVLNEITRQCAG